MEKFRKLGLSEQLLKSIESAGFAEPTEIQEKAIPLILKGKDVIGSSSTGSGKTIAFGAGIIEKAEKGKGLQALILAPTRELAEQIGTVFKKFSSYKKLSIAIVYGGVNINPQIRDIRNAEIVVGTPGRILDHMERGTIDVSRIKTLVLDEADRMLDMGFIRDMERIIKNCPDERQTLLFSATISHEIERIADRYMVDAERISAVPRVSSEKLKHIYYDVPANMKFSLLVHLLKKERTGLVMVFCNTRHNTDFVAKNLQRFGIDALAIHGGLTQDKRKRILEKFHEKSTFVLVCTDVAARGLDIKGVSHVYNYDIPKTSDEYIHRSGRTARIGKEGISISILANRDYENFASVVKDESLDIKREELPQMEQVKLIIDDRRGGFNRERSFGGNRSYGNRGGFGNRERSFGRDRERNDGFRRERPRGSGFSARHFSPGRGGRSLAEEASAAQEQAVADAEENTPEATTENSRRDINKF